MRCGEVDIDARQPTKVLHAITLLLTFQTLYFDISKLYIGCKVLSKNKNYC